MVYVIKKENETSSALVRRFMQRVQASGVLREAKKKKFFRGTENRNMRRQAAVERAKKTETYLKLWKMGKTK